MIQERLQSRGLSLPPAPVAAGNYLPYAQSGSLIFVSGQLPVKDGQMIKGKVGTEVSLEEAQEAARRCLLNGLAILNGIAPLEKMRIVRLGGFVASAPGFTDQPKVINGASDLLVELLGDNGKHARAAVGVAELPLGASVEIELTAELA